MPKFHLGFFFAVLAGYFASMIESIGDYHAASYMAGAGDPTAKQLDRGIGMEGVGCSLTALLGGFASTSYSENIGLIGLTGSRRAGSYSLAESCWSCSGSSASSVDSPPRSQDPSWEVSTARCSA